MKPKTKVHIKAKNPLKPAQILFFDAQRSQNQTQKRANTQKSFINMVAMKLNSKVHTTAKMPSFLLYTKWIFFIMKRFYLFCVLTLAWSCWQKTYTELQLFYFFVLILYLTNPLAPCNRCDTIVVAGQVT